MIKATLSFDHESPAVWSWEFHGRCKIKNRIANNLSKECRTFVPNVPWPEPGEVQSRI